MPQLSPQTVTVLDGDVQLVKRKNSRAWQAAFKIDGRWVHRRTDGHRVHVINYHHVIHALRRKPQALWSSIYRDSLFPKSEYAEAWKVLQRGLPRRDACRRMVDLLFIARDQACEAELAHLLAGDLDAGRVPEPKLLASQSTPRHMALPTDIAVAHPSLDSFDALLGPWMLSFFDVCNKHHLGALRCRRGGIHAINRA